MQPIQASGRRCRPRACLRPIGRFPERATASGTPTILRLRRWGHTPKARFGTGGRIWSSISQGALSFCKLRPIATPVGRNDEIARDPPRPFECRSDCQPDHAVDDSATMHARPRRGDMWSTQRPGLLSLRPANKKTTRGPPQSAAARTRRLRGPCIEAKLAPGRCVYLVYLVGSPSTCRLW